MSVDVKGTNCKLWIKAHEGKNGNKWNTYTVGVSSKDMDGQYINAYQDVKFTRSSGFDETIANGTIFDFEGWMSAKTRKDKDGKSTNYPIIVINKAVFKNNPNAKFDSGDSFEQLDEDCPF